MLWIKICLIEQILFFVLPVISSYRLNVPRVLLPYHPDIQVSFELLVTDPEGGCFKWRSTRNDIVTVKLHDKNVECSDRAIIYATSKHENEQTAMVFAEDKDSGVMLSCGVAVDTIKSIVISTTTKVLFLDAGPSQMVIHALNSEGDMFSNLGAIPFEWELRSGPSKRPLRIVPFAQSKYEAPDGVRYLEENKKRGYIVLVEGVQTGTATLKVKLSEPYFKMVSSHEIVLLVVANLLLVPSCDLYLPVGSVVRYSAQIVKQGTTEPISLPSKQYQLEIANTSTCSLNEDLSSVIALSLGGTELSLIDKNVKANVALKPPSVHIYVVEPSVVSFAISGESWYLEVGCHYSISVQAYDTKDNLLHIADNAVFDTQIPQEFFKILSSSKNGTYFEVKAIKNGAAKLRSRFVSVGTPGGIENIFVSTLFSEQLAAISEPIVITPSVIVFPYTSGEIRHSSQLKASGGTGVFTWFTGDSTIARVDATGLVTSERIGEVEILAKDLRNPLHFATALIKVLPPTKIAFVESSLEIPVGSILKLGISMYVESGGNLWPVRICNHVAFSTSVSDSTVFEIIKAKSQPLDSPNGACATLPLRALASGDATVNVTFGKISAIAYVSAFNKLKLKLPNEVLLTCGSEITVEYSDGPRPWILDRSKYFAKFEYSNAINLVRHSYSNNQMRLACNEGTGDILVRLTVGNYKTQTNPMPVTAAAEVRICCATPSRLEVGIERTSKSKGDGCPKTSPVLYTKESSKLFLRAYGICPSGPMMGLERQFDSISNILVDWSAKDAKLLKVEGFKDEAIFEKLFAIARPRGLPGLCSVKAKVDSFAFNGKKKSFPSQLIASLDFSLMERARVDPNEIVLWNERGNKRKTKIAAGSGHFEVLHGYDSTVINVAMTRDTVEITPLRTGKTTVSFIDLCFGNQFEMVVTVTDLDHISIEAPKHIEIHNELPLTVRVGGTEGVIFTVDDVAAIDVKIDFLSDILSVVRVDPLHYRLQGKSVGTSALKASARSAVGEIIYSLPHEVQVFAPLVMSPKLVTLIPYSIFQFELSGGPQPNPPVNFALNDSSVASVDSEGIIKSEKLGSVSVSGSLNLDNGFSKDSAIVKVVSLNGIKIVVSSLTIDQGSRAWARIEGIGSDETPFSFCGALYPLLITWSLGGHGIVEMTSPLGVSVSESRENHFQVFLKALNTGQTEIKANIVLHPEAPPFTSRRRFFEDHVTITVNDPIKLVQPIMSPSSIIISPDSRMELKANRPNGSMAFNVPVNFQKIISLSGGDHPVLHGHEIGEAMLEIRDYNAVLNRTAFIGISVVTPHSIFLELNDVVPLTEDGRVLSALPLGFRIHLVTGTRDHYGRLLHASALKARFRPHRFDLTEVIRTGQQTVEVFLKQAGETTVMVWDESNPVMNAFLRIPVAPIITPAFTGILLYDLICFKSILPNPSWSELSPRKRFEFLDSAAGIVVTQEIGTAVIGAAFPDNQTTFAEMTISEPEGLSFGEVPSFITNVGHQQYLFPVFLKGDGVTTNVHGCDLRDVEKFDGLKAPFDCLIYFEKEMSVAAQKLFFARSVFSSVTNSYGCLLERMPIDYGTGFNREIEGEIIVKIMLTVLGKEYKAETRTHFYPCFEVEQTELRLDNINSEGSITVRATDSIVSSMVVDVCNSDVLHVRKGKSTNAQTMFYKVKLNVNSALVWQEYLKECNVTIRNTLTGQIEEIPVKFILPGGATKGLKSSSESTIGQLYEKATLYLSVIGTLIVTALTGLAFLAWYKGYSILPLLFAPVYKPQPGVIGVFASERGTTVPGHVSPSRSLKQSFLSTSRERNSAGHFLNSINGSPQYSSMNRSAGSAGDSFLWSNDGFKSTSLKEKSL